MEIQRDSLKSMIENQLLDGLTSEPGMGSREVLNPILINLYTIGGSKDALHLLDCLSGSNEQLLESLGSIVSVPVLREIFITVAQTQTANIDEYWSKTIEKMEDLFMGDSHEIAVIETFNSLVSNAISVRNAEMLSREVEA